MSGYGNYSSTNYGASGGEDGGGFVYGSQGGSQSGAKPINDESLRPVTVKQLIDAEPAYSSADASFRIDGLDVKQVTFVGMVRAISPQTTNITYKIDDGTGVIEVKQWVDSDKQQADAPASTFEKEEYVRVWGRMKSFSNKRHVGAHAIKPVRDFNEVNYHLLEATYVHLFLTKGPPAGEGGGGGGGGGEGDSMFVDDDRARGLSARARRMYSYLNNTANASEGVNMHEIARETGMTVQDVMAAAEELLGSGVIYTTLDDETFAVLDGY
ncbi:replication protein A, subunit RPA32 [Xylariomycetidae sp. FL0641]|nr:replication protein A, subunit RPA32 [Xylariomycetidae sp. FL0641]